MRRREASEVLEHRVSPLVSAPLPRAPPGPAAGPRANGCLSRRLQDPAVIFGGARTWPVGKVQGRPERRTMRERGQSGRIATSRIPVTDSPSANGGDGRAYSVATTRRTGTMTGVAEGL